ncbi:MAG: ATP-binding protein, partial [Desulfuromonadales bacterium]|nr:ATP-binding protein [Desulfuromonadales bacterium]
GSLPLLRVNFQELQQLLLNLIKNAHYALDKKPSETENDKWLKISAVTIDNETGPAIRLSVADNGIGIPPEILDRVLNPFVTTKPAGSGTGLGLSLGHDIVKRHGGQIQIESEHHIGTQVLVDLPLPKKRP